MLVAAVALVSVWSGTASGARHHVASKGHGRPFLADWVRSFKAGLHHGRAGL